jgi:hypothetical protein
VEEEKMRKKSKVAERARILKIEDIAGWILIAKEDDADEWHIAWLDPFGTKKRALAFAATHHWAKPYQAVRGRVTVL